MIKFIKRLCYKISKRFLRFFIFFQLIVLFIFFNFSAFAITSNPLEFNRFSKLINNGTLSFYSGVDYGLYDVPWRNALGGQDPDNWIVIDAPSEIGYMDSFGFKISDSDNFSSFAAGDVLYLRNSVSMACRTPGTQIYYNYSNSDLSDIRVRIDTAAGYTVLSGDDVLQSLSFDNDYNECTINFEINYQFTTASTLRSLTFYFYHCTDDYDIGINFVGNGSSYNSSVSDNYKIIYYLGPRTTLDSYLNTDYLSGIADSSNKIGAILKDNLTNDFPEADTSLNDELGNKEDQVLNSFDYDTAYNDLFDGTYGFKGQFNTNLHIRRCFLCIADMIDYSLTFTPLRFLIYISISLGLLSMALNFTAVLVSNMRQDKRGDFNKHGNGNYDREA